MMKRLLILLLPILLLYSCRQTLPTRTARPGNHYATGFELADSCGITIATVYTPWEPDKVMARYVITEPFRRLCTASCTHIGCIAALGELDKIVGVCNPELSYTLAHSDHQVMNTGDAMSPDVERILLTHPDGVMISTYAQGDQSAKHLQQLDIPILFNNEWLESEPLARAEWIRFIGALLGCQAKADSLFVSVEERYISLRDSIRNQSHPTILSGQDFRGTWYVPAGGTYMGRLFADAGADYRYSQDLRSESIPLTTESVLREFGQADVWVGCSARTLDELVQIDAKHQWFKAYQNGRVYNFLHRTTPTGGNDFWERGVVHPEEVLEDLIHILYPDTTAYQLHYAEQLR